MNSNCCSMMTWWKTIGMAALLGSFFAVGWYTGHGQRPISAPMKLLADSSTRGENVSTATGPINGDLEGLFILDHETGQLYCVMINPRTATQVGFYAINVRQALALDRQGDVDFSMVTGFSNLNEAGRVGGNRMANCLCYVTEGVTGRVAAFGLSYNETGLQRNIAQQGTLIKIWDSPIRDQKLPAAAAGGDALPGEKPGAEPGKENAGG